MKDYVRDAKIYKAFCDEKRLKIIDLLTGGEMCACALIEKMEMAQSALSYQMKILCESGIVQARQDGKWMRYSLNEEGIEYASKHILELTAKQ